MAHLKKQASIVKQFERAVQYSKTVNPAITVHELKSRYDSLVELYMEFKLLQDQIEANCGDESVEIQYTVREQIEEYYHLCAGTLNEFIEAKEKNLRDKKRDQRSHQNTNNLPTAEIKLPRLSIPQFDGNYAEWPAFKDFFTSLIHDNKSLRNVQKFHYLRDNITGPAKDLIKSLHVTEDNYQEAWNRISKRFEHKRFIVDTHLQEFFNQQSIMYEDPTAIKNLIDKSTEIVRSLDVLNLPVEHWDALLVHVVTSKLDKETHKQWELTLNKDELPTFKALSEFMENRWQSLEMIINSKAQNSLESHQATNQHQSNNNQATNQNKNRQANQTIQNKVNLCVCCNKQGHTTGFCSEFISLSYDSKISFIKSKKLCFNCLRPNHNTTECKNPSKCQQCNKKHHTLIHKSYPQYNSNTTEEEQQSRKPNPFVRSTTVVTNDCRLLATAIVNVTTVAGKLIPVRALIDNGSESSIIKMQLAKQLGVLQEHQNMPIIGVGDTVAQEKTTMVKIEISSCIDPTFKMEVDAYTMEKVSANLPSTNIDKKNWKHLNGLKLADKYYEKSAPIDLLLGVEVYEEILLDGIIKKINNSPTATNSTLGWLMCGNVKSQETAPKINSFHVTTEGETLNETIKAFWQLEEIPQERKLTVKEQQAENEFQSNVKKTEEGRYQVTLPFDQDKADKKLGESRNAAKHCLYQMEKRFSLNPILKERYYEYIQTMMDSKHIELVPNNRMNVPTENKFYLPHHAVLKESSLTTKLRVVFNASRKSATGISLNDKLLIGPTIQDELYEILVRWRIHYIAFIADIEKMFRQIEMSPECRDYQRILWRFSTEQPILEYRITRVIEGTASATFLAARTLKQTAIDGEREFPNASKVVMKDFYMDDVSSGSSDLDSAIKLQNDLITLLNQGKFVLRKWFSNSKELLENVPLQNRHDPDALVELIDCSIKTLGVHWNQKSDCFEFKVSLSPAKPKFTKREVLSDIAKLFDPIGWLSPTIVVAKTFMQSLWTIKQLDWDKYLPQDKYNEWMEFRNQLSALESIKIARWIGVTEACKIEIHGFSDASTKAYAAVVYTRIEFTDGTIKISLISGKTKVAPIKVISTPKLELCGCVLLSSLATKIAKAFGLKELDTYLYSDSTVCLAWITSHPNHWNVFVANRITEIQQLTNTQSWNFVDTNHNPADCASRGVSPAILKQHPLWWHGPDWLTLDKGQWPNHQTEKYETDLEKRRIVRSLHITIQSVDHHMEKVLKSFSELSSLLKTTSYILRWSPNHKTKPKSTTPSANEYRKALKAWTKSVQAESFGGEIESCLNNDELQTKSKLNSLRPFLDEDGILRVGGRLSKSDLPFESKHPIILPKRHHLTKLIIEQAHKLTLHGGPSLMSAFLNKYWIFGRSEMIRRTIKHCIKCYPYLCKPQQQVMADLPKNRVVPNRIFSHSGVDFAGPIMTKNFIGRSRGKYANVNTKSYVAIFVCLSTKAVHIEFVSDLTSQKFIEAFKRFVARKGQVTDLYSDNGTNFVGAERILQEHLNELVEDPTLQNYFARQGTTWHFNPPASPHHGGLWEAGVKSIKYHLKRLVGDCVFTFEEMTTILSQIEACLNSRPLCSINDDLNDMNYLTPGHFYLGEAPNTVPEPSLLEKNPNRLKRWQLVQRKFQEFWHYWSKDYLSKLQKRSKWEKSQENVKVGQLALYREDNLPPAKWPLAKIIEIHPGHDENTRVVTLKTSGDRIMKRPIHKISILPIE